MSFRPLLLAVLFGACADSAGAQNAQTYLYDANGRLIGATTASATGDASVSSYVLDDADNRVAHGAMAVTPPPTADKLARPYALVPTQELTSANGQYSLSLETSGDLVIRNAAGTLIWNSCTGQGRTLFAGISASGLLTIYDARSNPIWSAGSSGNAGKELTLQNTEVAVLKAVAGNTLWTSGTPCA